MKKVIFAIALLFSIDVFAAPYYCGFLGIKTKEQRLCDYLCGGLTCDNETEHPRASQYFECPTGYDVLWYSESDDKTYAISNNPLQGAQPPRETLDIYQTSRGYPGVIPSVMTQLVLLLLFDEYNDNNTTHLKNAHNRGYNLYLGGYKKRQTQEYSSKFSFMTGAAGNKIYSDNIDKGRLLSYEVTPSYDIPDRSMFVTYEGKELSYSNWAKYEPNNDFPGSVVVYMSTGSKENNGGINSGLWYDKAWLSGRAYEFREWKGPLRCVAGVLDLNKGKKAIVDQICTDTNSLTSGRTCNDNICRRDANSKVACMSCYTGTETLLDNNTEKNIFIDGSTEDFLQCTQTDDSGEYLCPKNVIECKQNKDEGCKAGEQLVQFNEKIGEEIVTRSFCAVFPSFSCKDNETRNGNICIRAKDSCRDPFTLLFPRTTTDQGGQTIVTARCEKNINCHEEDNLNSVSVAEYKPELDMCAASGVILCPLGYTNDNGTCTKPLSCPIGFAMKEGYNTCVSETPLCGASDNFTLVNGQGRCRQRVNCPSGTTVDYRGMCQVRHVGYKCTQRGGSGRDKRATENDYTVAQLGQCLEECNVLLRDAGDTEIWESYDKWTLIWKTELHTYPKSLMKIDATGEIYVDDRRSTLATFPVLNHEYKSCDKEEYFKGTLYYSNGRIVMGGSSELINYNSSYVLGECVRVSQRNDVRSFNGSVTLPVPNIEICREKCPNSYTWNVFTAKCEQTGKCAAGYTFNEFSQSCEKAAQYNEFCDISNVTSDGKYCKSDGACEYGAAKNGKCVYDIKLSKPCGQGYTYQDEFKRCVKEDICRILNAVSEKLPTAGNVYACIDSIYNACRSGYTLNGVSGQCERKADGICGNEYTYRADTTNFTGSIDTSKGLCVRAGPREYACPSYPDNPCIKTGYNTEINNGISTLVPKYQCSPYKCGGISYDPQIQMVGINDTTNDNSESCTPILFSGKDSRCRVGGPNIGFQSCCSTDGKANKSAKEVIDKIKEDKRGCEKTAVTIAVYASAMMSGIPPNLFADMGITFNFLPQEHADNMTSTDGWMQGIKSGGEGTFDCAKGIIEAAWQYSINYATLGIYHNLTDKGCTQSELNVAEKIAADPKKCFYVGEYCSLDLPVFGCAEHTRSYCCFANTFEYTLAKAARTSSQRTEGYLSWGSNLSPNCRGITINEFQKINFGDEEVRKAFDEYVAHISQNMKDKANCKVNASGKEVCGDLGFTTDEVKDIADQIRQSYERTSY